MSDMHPLPLSRPPGGEPPSDGVFKNLTSCLLSLNSKLAAVISVVWGCSVVVLSAAMSDIPVSTIQLTFQPNVPPHILDSPAGWESHPFHILTADSLDGNRPPWK